MNELARFLPTFLEGFNLSLPQNLVPVVAMFLCGSIVAAAMGLSAAVLVWAERKLAGHFQCRLGPVYVGGKFGWLQSIADGIKLFLKEDIIPTDADRPLFRLAPYLAVIGVLAAFVAFPISEHLLVADLNIGIFFILAVLTVEVFGVILAGWASNNKWSLLGAMRAAAQMVSSEIPMGLAILLPVMTAESLSLKTIVADQSGGILKWYVFQPPFFMAVAFLIFFVAGLASLKRSPFDLPEAESELTAGFHTEYSGMRFSFFFMAEYAGMLLVSGLAALLYLGGWHGILPGQSGVEWFLLKTSFLLFVMIWIRWTLPRLRIDQVVYVGWKVMTPFALVCVLGQAAAVHFRGG
ncbi:NADH-quinone oxidoreductase subunit NuoH [bacterium]|nr:NADH-quinone oxidoreductase subunit NuoH [bacterium]